MVMVKQEVFFNIRLSEIISGMAVHAILKVEILQNYIHFLRWNLRTMLRVKHAFFLYLGYQISNSHRYNTY